ncbi:MAG: hypothetical protein K8S56_06700 [Candidatus Cloacimonetes bacterium]|nr:hypothetical protein [Candidatus Cloacimonadota bacterium]
MKRKKWLLIIVAVIFLLYLAVWGTFRFVHIDEYARSKVIEVLSRQLNAEVGIGDFSVNDRVILVDSLTIRTRDKKADVSIQRIYISYNLFSLVFSGFDVSGAIGKIFVEQPDIALCFTSDNLKKQEKKAGKSKKFESTDISSYFNKLPDISAYFQRLVINNGQVSIDYQDSTLHIHEVIDSINLEIVNTFTTSLLLTAEKDEGELQLKGTLAGNTPQEFLLQLTNLQPGSLESALFSDLEVTLGAQVRYHSGSLEYRLTASNPGLVVQNIQIQADSVVVSGNSRTLHVDIPVLWVDREHAEVSATIFNPFSGKRKIEGVLKGAVKLRNWEKDLCGEARIIARIRGQLSKPNIDSRLTTTQVMYKNYPFGSVQLMAKLNETGIELTIEELLFQNNLLTGSGFYSKNGTASVRLYGKNFTYPVSDHSICSDIETQVDYDSTGIKALLQLKRTSVIGKTIDVRNLRGFARLVNDSLFVRLEPKISDINQSSNAFRLEATGNIRDMTFNSDLQLYRMGINSLLVPEKRNSDLPALNGSVTVKYNPNNLTTNLRLRVYDEQYGQLDGFLYGDAVFDFLHDRSYLSLYSRSGKYKFEPFAFDIQAAGTLDSLQTINSSINDDIKLNVWAKFQPEFDFGLSLEAEKISLPGYLRYFMNYYEAQQLPGKLSFNLAFNSKQQQKFSGWAKLTDFRVKHFGNLELSTTINGTTSRFDLKEISLSRQDEILATAGMTISLKPEFQIESTVSVDELDLRKLGVPEQLSGIATVNAEVDLIEGDIIFDVQVAGQQLNIFGIFADSLNASIRQEPQLLVIEKLNSGKSKYYDMAFTGSIGYHLITREIYKSDNLLIAEFNGDLMRFLSDSIEPLHHGRSMGRLNLQVSIDEDGLSVRRGYFRMEKGKIQVDTQPLDVENFNLFLTIEDNQLDIKDFRFKIGNGYLKVANEHTGYSHDFVLGMLQLGIFHIRTDDEGLLINIPAFTPGHTMSNVRITGRNRKELLVKGPFEDIEIIGDVEISDSEAIFPPGVKNLLSLFTNNINFNTNDRDISEERVSLPLNLDVIVRLKENIRYVTTPADLIIRDDSFIHLKYDKERFTVEQAEFLSERGTLEMFGIMFDVDYVEIILGKFMKQPRIVGKFLHRAADGSMISLHVFPSDGSDTSGFLKFELTSDNADDTDMLDILTKLRYNRGDADLSAQEERELLQDEAIMMAGSGLSSTYIDPLISPLENRLRQFLRLDFLYIKFGIVENLFTKYAQSDTGNELNNTDTGQEDWQDTGSSILLNKLSLSLGKYVYEKLFTEYTGTIVETTDIESKEMQISHDFTFRYDLPKRYKIQYTYRIDRETEINSHEVMLSRAFRFWWNGASRLPKENM